MGLFTRTKAEAEMAVREVKPDAVIARPSVVFGKGDDFLNKFAKIAQLAPALPLIGGGQTKFQPVYVGDVGAAIARCAEAPEAAGQTYELGGPAVVTFEDVMKLVLRETYLSRGLLPLPFFAARILGGFAQHAYVLPGSGRIRVPEEIPDALASMASCALRSVVNAVRQGGPVEAGQTVVVQGSGTLGVLATGLYKMGGAGQVITIGAPQSRLSLARDFGADQVISIDTVADPGERLPTNASSAPGTWARSSAKAAAMPPVAAMPQRVVMASP